jgi:signal transduction histidine kinase
MLMSFLGPLAIVLVPLLGRIPAMAASELAATLMLPLMMLTVAFAIRFASGTMTLQQHQLEEKDRELRALLAKSSKRERLLNTILETVDVGLVAVDANGHQILKNRQQQLFHQLANPAEKPDPDESQLQVFGQDRTTPLPPQRRPIRRAANGETFSDALVWLGEGPAQRAVSVAARAMREGNGKFSGSVVVFSDVTELVEAISAKEEFISHVAHELSTPLTSILSYLDLVLDTDQELPDHAGTYLKVVRRNAERLVSLVSDLLAAASSAMNIHPRPTDLATLVEASIETFLTQAKRAGIGLVRDMPDPLWTYADPVRIGQVLDNLLSNAIKYSPGGGCVTIRAREHGDCVELQVADTGMGMTEAEAAQAFSKFFRTSAARRSAAPGVGLGLSITKAIVEGHGGTISCASRPGAGTTFTVVLPARPAAATHPVPGTDPSAAAPNPAAGAR